MTHPAAQISEGTVVSALSHMGFYRHGTNITADDLADYLAAPLDTVAPLLRRLHKRRVIRKVQRDKRQVWIPWGGQR